MAALAVGALGLGCVTGPALRDPQARISSARLAALPAQVDAFRWVPGGRRVGDHELMETVRGNVDDSINYRLGLHGARSFVSSATGRLEHFSEFYHWSWRTLHEIMAERLGDAPATHKSVAEWRFPADIASWRPVLNADFVLVSFILYGDSRDPSIRNLVFAGGAAEGAALTGSGSRAIACVVALNEGRVVWCNFIPNNSVVMQERPAAQSAVDLLVGDMLKLADQVPAGPSGSVQPPAPVAP
ncbi:MAG TPA: hypothetical protein VKZ18_06270 [Polyangia bacterium]|nr:hypothetical protein [Polyangia bacterium]